MQYRNVTGLCVCGMIASLESLHVCTLSAYTTCAMHMLRTNCKLDQFVNMPLVAVVYVKYHMHDSDCEVAIV